MRQGRRRRRTTPASWSRSSRQPPCPCPTHLAVLHRPEPLHRLPGVRAGVHRVRHAPGRLDDPPRVRRSRAVACRPCRSSACTASTPTCAEVCPADAIKRTGDGVVQTARKPRCIACSNCVLACPFGVPKMNDRLAADDEVRHVLRPHVRRQEADVRDGLPEPGALLRHARGDRAAAAAVDARSTTFQFGDQTITTQVNMMVPRGADRAGRYVDVTAAMDEQARSRAVSLKVVPVDESRGREPAAKIRLPTWRSRGTRHFRPPDLPASCYLVTRLRGTNGSETFL